MLDCLQSHGVLTCVPAVLTTGEVPLDIRNRVIVYASEPTNMSSLLYAIAGI